MIYAAPVGGASIDLFVSGLFSFSHKPCRGRARLVRLLCTRARLTIWCGEDRVASPPDLHTGDGSIMYESLLLLPGSHFINNQVPLAV